MFIINLKIKIRKEIFETFQGKKNEVTGGRKMAITNSSRLNMEHFGYSNKILSWCHMDNFLQK